VDIYAAGTDVSTALTGNEVAQQINLFSNQTGVTAAFDGGAGTMTLTAVDGRDIVVSSTVSGGASQPGDLGITGTNRGAVTLTASENITLTGTDATNDVLGVGTSISKDSDTLNEVSVTDVTNANEAIQRIDAALQSVNTFRSDLGAIQNRLESTIVNLSTTSENLSASRGRIQDADFAAETAALTRSQILQQAGVAMLSQANTQPQIALSLLG